MALRDLLDKRNRLVVRMREINDKAAAESRALTSEEDANYTAAFKEADELRASIEREEQLAKIEASIGLRSERHDGGGEQRKSTMQVRAVDDPKHRYRVSPASAPEAVRRLAESRSTPEYHESWRDYLATGEKRALSAGSGPDGGFLTAPLQWVQDLIQAVDDLVFIRARATVRTVLTATSLGVPTLDADPADADWTSELATGSEDSSMKVGKRELTPHPLAKRIKISEKLLRQASGADALALQRLAYKFAITEEKALLLADGVQKPLGVFTPSVDGIPTTRDVATGATTDFTMDGLINVKFSLKAPYLTNAAWAFHRDGVAKISKLKDTTNQYLWQPSTQVGQPDRLLGLPVFMSEFIPNTFTTGLYVGMLADWSFVWIADALDMRVKRLDELYAESNQVGYIARKEMDAQPVLAEAFARIKTS